MKTEIHTQILNTKSFLWDFLGLRYLQNKRRILIRLFWSKLALSNLELLHILKTIKIKTVITFIHSVWDTRPTNNHLGAIRVQLAELGTKFVVLRPLWDSMNMSWSVSESHFVLWIFRPPNIAQKWFCIQNLRMDLSFQGKKRFENPIHGCWDMKQKPSLIFFGTPCTCPRVGWGLTVIIRLISGLVWTCTELAK